MSVAAAFTEANYVTLLVSIILFYWEPYTADWSDFTKRNATRWIGVIPFVPVWFVLKAMNATALFLYFVYSTTSAHWTFQTVPALIIANALLAKAWSVLFVKKETRGFAALLSWALFGTALAALIIMGIDHTNQSETLWYVPLILYCFYTAWLFFASGVSTVIAMPGLRTILRFRCPEDGNGANQHKYGHPHGDHHPHHHHTRAKQYEKI